MIIFVESRSEMGTAIVSEFNHEAVAAATFQFVEAADCFNSVPDSDIAAVTGVLLGFGGSGRAILCAIGQRANRPVIALSERRPLAKTLDLLGVGVDDVVAKSLHVRGLFAHLRVRDITATLTNGLA